MGENLRIDHVIFGSVDIDATAARLKAEHGLGSVVGGRHEGRGTGNRIVPLGSAYLELMGVVDQNDANAHPFGRWFQEQMADGDRLLMWCLGTDDIEAVSRRPGLSVEEWSRVQPDGATLSWKLAGLEVSNKHPEIPFFIQWTTPAELHPSRAPATHHVVPHRFSSIGVAGDELRVLEWLGGATLDVALRLVTGRQGLSTSRSTPTEGRSSFMSTSEVLPEQPGAPTTGSPTPVPVVRRAPRP